MTNKAMGVIYLKKKYDPESKLIYFFFVTNPGLMTAVTVTLHQNTRVILKVMPIPLSLEELLEEGAFLLLHA